MVVKYVTENGMQILGPPYTAAEDDAFYEGVVMGPGSTIHHAKSSVPPAPADPKGQPTLKE